MADTTIIYDFQVKEQRGFIKRFYRVKLNGGSLEWPNAAFEFRVAADLAGDYRVMTLTPTLYFGETNADGDQWILEVNVSDEENKMKGGRNYYYAIVAIPEGDNSFNVYEGIINAKTTV
jgi:hypothetical protein